MKKLILLLAVIVLAIAFGLPGWARPPEKVSLHLFILSGQSNMEGLDPNQTFTPTVNEAFGIGHVIVVKNAVGGQSIRRGTRGGRSRVMRMPSRLVTSTTGA